MAAGEWWEGGIGIRETFAEAPGQVLLQFSHMVTFPATVAGNTAGKLM